MLKYGVRKQEQEQKRITLEAIMQKRHRNPIKWIADRFPHVLSLTAIIPTTTMTAAVLLNNGDYRVYIGLAVGAAFSYLAGTVADIASTQQFLRVADQAARLGIESPFRESNPFLGPNPAPEQIARDKGMLLMDCAVMALGTFFPATGLGLGAGKMVVGACNLEKTLLLRSIMKMNNEEASRGDFSQREND